MSHIAASVPADSEGRPLILSRSADWPAPPPRPVSPKLSVISCSFNLARFLEDTILSVARQTSREFEHIVIDGGSVDGSVDILKRYPHLRWISEEDRGYSDALWKGLRMARGAYVTQCAVSDGYLNPDWLKLCVEAMDRDPEVSLVWGFPQDMTEQGILGKVSYPEFHRALPPQKAEWMRLWLRTCFILPEGNFCVRKDVFTACYPRPEECARDMEPFCEFNYRFNTKGYLPWHVPVVANFGRTHGNQLGQVQGRDGTMVLKLDAYTRKRTEYRDSLIQGKRAHVFLSGASTPLPHSLPAETVALDAQSDARRAAAADQQSLQQRIRGRLALRSRWRQALSLIRHPFDRLNGRRRYEREWQSFLKAAGPSPRLPARRHDRRVCLDDYDSLSGFCAHYFYHQAWAARVLAAAPPAEHVDISSHVDFAAIVSAFVKVRFYDLHPPPVAVNGLATGAADLTRLPFADRSIMSLSCMHVIEHIGLGRYGDALDPDGDVKAARELARVLAPGGRLLLVVPVGRRRLEFNAHRVYSFEDVIRLFADLTVRAFALIPDDALRTGLMADATPAQANAQEHGCGCFVMRRES